MEVDQIVDTWFQKFRNGGSLARATDAYNEVYLALPDLKAALAALTPPAPAAEPIQHAQEEHNDRS